MTERIRADIRDGIYHVGRITAGTLPSLCRQLAEAGFDPEASVECYRPGRETWDIRAETVRAGAAPVRESGYPDAAKGDPAGFRGAIRGPAKGGEHLQADRPRLAGPSAAPARLSSDARRAQAGC